MDDDTRNDLIHRRITSDEYDYLREVVEEIPATQDYIDSQMAFIRSLGINAVSVKGKEFLHGKRFRKVRLRDGTICMSCKELKRDDG